jgi:hypothetical protein
MDSGGLICLLVCAIALFFGLFFGLLYPEIPKTGYVKTQCIPVNATIVPRYCCYKACTACGAAPNAPTCGGVIAGLEATPTSIPVSPQTCNNGFKCCATRCSSCCSMINGHLSCHSCNCQCVSSTSALHCEARCDLCYSTQLIFKVDETTTTTLTEDYTRDLTKAEQRLAEFPLYIPVTCYHPSNSTQVVFSIEYHVPSIALTTVFGILPLYVLLWYATIFFTETVKWPCVFWGSLVPFMVFMGVWSATKELGYLVASCVLLSPLVVAVFHSGWVRLRAPKIPVATPVTDPVPEPLPEGTIVKM